MVGEKLTMDEHLNDWPHLTVNDDTIGYDIVASIGNNLDQNWSDEFIEWYKPKDWLGSHRAAIAFLTEKFKATVLQPASNWQEYRQRSSKELGLSASRPKESGHYLVLVQFADQGGEGLLHYTVLFYDSFKKSWKDNSWWIVRYWMNLPPQGEKS